MKTFIKNGLHIIIPTLCLILCVVIILPLGVYRIEGRKIGYDYSAEASPNAVYPVSYTVNGSVYTPEGHNSYLVLPVPADKEINDVRIVFKRPLRSDCTIKLLYGNEKTALSEENAIVKEVKKGSIEYYCTLDTDIYTIIECHIPVTFELESVILSHVTSSESVYETVVDQAVLIWTLAPVTLLYAGIVIILIIEKRKKKNKK